MNELEKGLSLLERAAKENNKEEKVSEVVGV